jgi:hypothetical protein
LTNIPFVVPPVCPFNFFTVRVLFSKLLRTNVC